MTLLQHSQRHDYARQAARGLKVAMLVANAGTGDARVMKQAESLVAAGHGVTVYCLAVAGKADLEIVNGVTYRRCQEWHRGTASAKAASGPKSIPSAVQQILQSAKGLIEPFVRHELLATTFIATVVAAAPDIIHAHDFETLPAAVRAARRCGARVVYDMHELEEGRLPAASTALAAWKTWLERRMLAHVSAAITVSPSIARFKARKYDIPMPALVLNAPRQAADDTTRPALRERCGIAADVPLGVFVGTVSEGRGIEQLIDAVDRFDIMHLAILGHIRPALQALLSTSVNRLGGRLHLLAPVPHDQVVGHIAGADFGICTIPPSCLNYDYCLPNKLFEMTLAGLPVLVANTTELSRFIAETRTGIAVDATNSVAIANGLARLHAARHELAPTAAALVQLRARYGWERQAARLLDVYDAVASAPRGVPAAMAHRALATVLRPVGYSVSGG